MARAMALFLIATVFGCAAYPCSLAPGYFHQVTAIRGRVVGHERQVFSPRWFRQLFSVGGASLTLYEYRSPITRPEDLKRVATIAANSKGEFDFGAVPKGHYSLDINVNGTDSMGGWFDVEVTDAVAPTQSILLDVTGLSPDCTGGHEFMERKAVNAQTH